MHENSCASMQLCQHPFSFTKLYASDAPSKLPLREFLWGLVVKGSRSLRFGIRVRILSTHLWIYEGDVCLVSDVKHVVSHSLVSWCCRCS